MVSLVSQAEQLAEQLKNLEEEIIYHNPSTDKLAETIKVTESTHNEHESLKASLEQATAGNNTTQQQSEETAEKISAL